MYKLFARKGAGSAAIEAMLALCGAPYEIQDLPRQADGAFPKWFHEINPRAEVPTLILPDDSVMTESAAIIMLLGERFPQAGLTPLAGSAQRARFLRWLMYLATTIYMSDLRMYYPQRYTTDAEGVAGIKAHAIAAMTGEFEAVAKVLGEGPFMLGDKLGALDLYLAMLVSWAPDVAATFARHPNLKRLCDLVAADPVVAKVWTRNGM